VDADASPAPFRVGFVTGVVPDRWARTWRDRTPRAPLELVPVTEEAQLDGLRDGSLHMAFVRLPVDRNGLHLIPLWEERPVVVVSREHPVAAYDEIAVAELSDELLLDDPSITTRQAIETVAAGTGIVIVPMSVARLHHRKDVTHRPVTGIDHTQIALAWPVGADDPRIETFIGIVRGRTERSSRAATAEPPRQAAPQPARRSRDARATRRGNRPRRGNR